MSSRLEERISSGETVRGSNIIDGGSPPIARDEGSRMCTYLSVAGRCYLILTDACRVRQFLSHVDGSNAVVAGKALEGKTVFDAFVCLHNRTLQVGNPVTWLERGDTGQAIQCDDSTADEVLAAKRFLRRRANYPVKQGM